MALPVVVGEQGVAADRPLGDADAVDGADLVEDLRGDRGRGWCRHPRSAVYGASVRTTASVPEEILPKSWSKAIPMVLVRISVPGQEGDAECDRRRGEEEAQLVRHHASQGCGQHRSGS